MCGTEESLAVKRSSVSPAVPEQDVYTRPSLSSDSVINLDQGDPTAFEAYWRLLGNRCAITFSGHQSLSYYSDTKNLCWFLEPKLQEEIKRLHSVVGNADTDGYYVIVGTGSSQLIQAALFALSSVDEPAPMNVVSAAPYYSMYPDIADFLSSRLFKWAGDAQSFNQDGPYIEFVTSPNNPDGVLREPVVNRAQGKLIHDLAYYWPQYTAITKPANNDIMLFTFSKCTGHAGSRIGWALVKDEGVARKMMKFIELSTIGVSKESQLRAAKILGVISDSCQDSGSSDIANFFEYAQELMTERWQKLRNAVKRSDKFTLSKYPLQYCNFSSEFTEAHPGFAWLKYEGNEDCEKLFRGHKILSRSGRLFGSDPRFARISMVGREEEFNLFIQRLLAIHQKY